MRKTSFIYSFVLFLFCTALGYAAPLPAAKDATNIYKDINPTIVSIYAETPDGQGAEGSGFIVDPSGVIVTNNHVVDGASNITITLNDGREFPVTSIIDCNPNENYDYCLLKIDAKNLPKAPLADSNALQIGEKVYCIGNPLGLTYSLSDGMLSGIRDFEGAKWLQFTAPISPGNSGGPVLNAEGKVIGITTFLLQLGQNLNFALAINEIKRAISTTPKMTMAEFTRSNPQADYFTALSAEIPVRYDGVSGIYDISYGVNPESRAPYSGSVIVVPDGPAYWVAWKFFGSPGYEGIGLVVDNTLCVGWSDGGFYGVMVYKVSKDKLKGKWVDAFSTGQVGAEELKGPAGLNGVYAITNSYSPQDGRSYRGTVEITKAGEIYSVMWRYAGREHYGVGILKDDLLIVGWGNTNGGGVVYYDLTDPMELKGAWAIPGVWYLGIEDLVRR